MQFNTYRKIFERLMQQITDIFMFSCLHLFLRQKRLSHKNINTISYEKKFNSLNKNQKNSLAMRVNIIITAKVFTNPKGFYLTFQTYAFKS